MKVMVGIQVLIGVSCIIMIICSLFNFIVKLKRKTLSMKEKITPDNDKIAWVCSRELHKHFCRRQLWLQFQKL